MLSSMKRLASAVIAGAFVAGSLTFCPEIFSGNRSVNAAELYDTANLVNYATILGRDVDYGIITDRFVQRAHVETTLATNSFKRDCDSQFDVDLTTNKTAQFIIGGLEAPYNDIKFGTVHKNRHAVYVKNINLVLAEGINTNAQIKKQDDVAQTTDFNYYFRSKQEIKDHIDSIIGHAQDESDIMVSRTNDNKYVLDNRYIRATGDVTTINIDRDEFENKVVYVNLDDRAFRSLLNTWRNDPNGRHFIINKRASTVVVFTYQSDAPVVLGKVEVVARDSKLYASASDGEEHRDNYYASSTTYNGDISGHNRYVDEEIARKIIWNMPNSRDITITGSAGTFLALRENVNVKLRKAPSAGWIVSRGTTTNDNDCEFHYIYCGASENLQTEGNGQMHFTMHKRFTKKYDIKEKVVNDNSVFFEAGDYEFFWQEYTDNTFTDKIGDSSTCAIDANSVIEFPTVTFVTDDENNPHYVARGTSKDFYFRITESPDLSLNGIANNSGYVDIRLNVFAQNDGKIFFTTQNCTYIQEDEEHEAFLYASNGDWMGTKWSDVVGNRFELGAFYNRIKTPGFINITKTIKGDVTEEDLNGLTFSVKTGGVEIANYRLGRDFTLNPETGAYELKRVLEVADSSKAYTVEETLQTVEGFTVTTSYTIDGSESQDGAEAKALSVSEDPNAPTTFAYENSYERIIYPGYINITKTIKGDVTQEDLDGLSFTVKDGETVVGTYKLGVDFKQNEDGTYELKKPIEVDDSIKTFTVEETLKTKDGYIISTSYSVDGGTSATGNTATLEGVSKDADNPTTVAYENGYERIIYPGYINITKTIEGDVTQEDLDGLSFTVKDGDTVVGRFPPLAWRTSPRSTKAASCLSRESRATQPSTAPCTGPRTRHCKTSTSIRADTCISTPE